MLALFIACQMDESNKKLPDCAHNSHDIYHAWIWDNDSANSHTPPLEAAVTINKDDFIQNIASWDGKQKTKKENFIPLKISWDPGQAEQETGTFTMLGKKFRIRLVEDIFLQPGDVDSSTAGK